MECSSCGEKHAFAVRMRIDKDGTKHESCNICGTLTLSDVSVPDVYFPGGVYTTPMICDNMGRPIPMTSKRDKARVMKSLNMSECGDMWHGSRDGHKFLSDRKRQNDARR